MRERRHEVRMAWSRMFSLGLAACLTLGTVPAGAEDFFGEGFEDFTGIPRESAHPLSEAEMDRLRGGFLGFYFSVYFSGMVESEGAVDGTLEVNANFGSQSGQLVFTNPDSTTAPVAEGGSVGSGGPSVVVQDQVSGEAFRVQSLIGDNAFDGASGAFQVSQIPGNGNNVGQVMVLNLAILQATDSNVAAVRDRLGSLFGLP
jgi:hypothetical protein